MDNAFDASSKITIHAGELLFGKGEKIVSTLLGSCIAITLFHHKTKLAGICHFALPCNTFDKSSSLNPRYADDCMALFDQHAKQHNILLSEFETNIIGGGNMLEKGANSLIQKLDYNSVGERNARKAIELCSQYNMQLDTIDVGEFGYRKLQFNTATGELKIKFSENVIL